MCVWSLLAIFNKVLEERDELMKTTRRFEKINGKKITLKDGACIFGNVSPSRFQIIGNRI